MDIAKIVLEYLKVVLSGPPVAGAAILLLALAFKKEFRELIGRIAEIKFPGGGLSTSQADRSPIADKSSPEAPPESSAEEFAASSNLNLTPEDQKKLADLIKAQRATAALWEYRYLNLYLVPTTHRVLDWLASLTGPATTDLFDSFWGPLVPSVQERNAILGALESHHLVQRSGALIEVSPKGREYLQWRGPLPQLDAPGGSNG